MSHTPLHEFFTKHPDFAERLNLLRAINTGQERLWNDPSGGLSVDTLSKGTLKSMQEQSLIQGTPVSYQVEESSYNLELLRKSLISMVYAVYEQGLDPTIDPVSLVKKMDEILTDIIVNTLKGNRRYFPLLGEEWGVSPLVLTIIGEALIQPSMIYLASACQRSYVDNWGDVACPVCGRYPSTAVKSDAEAWRFKCPLCRAEYKMDIFTCPYCKSSSHEEKEFLLVGESQEFELATCSKCNRYYKVINKSKLKEAIPEGLEDLYTYFLDEIAQERGLKRLDERGSGAE